ncbi:MAG: GldG family protein [Acidobacteriota bacterium]|jgi:ABC-type uncharacterized transport system involved in gliding motility auxiliary subunit|nr:GldG family protein [Acidobacteriota bacterium]
MKNILQKLDILGLVLAVAAVVWYSITNVWDKWNLSLAGAGAALIVIGVASNYKQVMATLGRRSSKYAANYAISLVLVLAVVVGLNYVGRRHVRRFDVTANSRFTLAPQTLKVVESLDKAGKDVEIKAFFPGGNHEPLQAMLTEYGALSRHLRYEFIDPDRQNDVANRYGVTVYGLLENPITREAIKFGTVVVSYGDRTERIEKRSEEIEEQDMTNALVKVSRTGTKKVYFISGHGEKDPDDSDRFGYALAKKALEEQGYAVDKANLVAEGKVPEDANVLVVAGPQNEPFPQEMDFIAGFLDAGGAALFMMDPKPSPALQGFFDGWGVQIDDDVVLDVSGVGRLMGASESMPLVRDRDYGQHPITDRFTTMTFFPLTRSIRPVDQAPDGVTVTTLFSSNASSWGETDLDSSSAEFNPDEDFQGPVPMAVAASKETAADDASARTARLVVTGTARFADNDYFPAQGNGNLFLNMVSWLAQDDDLISIRPRPLDDRRILLSEAQQKAIFFVAVILLPGIALLAGLVVVVRRRRM